MALFNTSLQLVTSLQVKTNTFNILEPGNWFFPYPTGILGRDYRAKEHQAE